MAYQGMINRNLNLAFRMLRDLAQPAEFVEAGSRTFDLETNETIESAPVRKQVLIVDTSGTQAREGQKVEKRQILFKTSEIPSLRNLSQVIYQGKTWSIGPVLNQNGPVTYLEIHKEA